MMESSGKTVITVETTVNAPKEKAWKYWNDPTHVTKWYNASDDWHAPLAENDLRPDGKFKIRMEAKDGSAGFDFEGTYINVVENKLIEYQIVDGRKVKIEFTENDSSTNVRESFEAENVFSLELQKQGWQSIVDNFKKYTEAN
jgi:uncharacterized protein YndB with AHSA1/START domain